MKKEEYRISTILNWSEPEFVCEIQSFLGFANFYYRFVKNVSKITHPLSDLTKKELQRTKKDLALQKTYFFTPEARRCFYELIATFISSQFFVYFDHKQEIKLEADASSYTISGIVSQK